MVTLPGGELAGGRANPFWSKKTKLFGEADQTNGVVAPGVLLTPDKLQVKQRRRPPPMESRLVLSRVKADTRRILNRARSQHVSRQGPIARTAVSPALAPARSGKRPLRSQR